MDNLMYIKVSPIIGILFFIDEILGGSHNTSCAFFFQNVIVNL